MNDRVGKPKTHPVPVSELTNMTPHIIEMFKFIFKPLFSACPGRFSTPIIPTSAPYAHR
jgi:hypothetical protein